MTTKNLSIKDDSFGNGIEQKLSVRIASTTFEIAVLDTSRSTIVAFESWRFDNNDDPGNFADSLEKIRSDSFSLGRHYNKANVIIDSAVYTLIPAELFKEEEAEKYIEFNHSLASKEAVHFDSIESIAVKNVYQVPLSVEKVCRQWFTDLKFQNTCTILINSRLKIKSTPETVFVYFSGNRFDVIVADNGRLKFCNSFTFSSAQDIIYYILNVYQKLGMDTSATPIMLAGEITKESSGYETIYRYIRNVSFAQRPDNIQLCEALKEMPEQMYFDLFSNF